MNKSNLTEGNIRKQLWMLAWPIMLSVFFNTFYNTVNAFWVSKLSSEAIAAVSISQISLFMMSALSMGITVGSGVLMAMHIGAQEMRQAGKILGQSFVLSAMMAALVTILALLFRDQLLVASGATGSIMGPAIEYFTIIARGCILSFIMFTIVFALNAQGNNKTGTWLFALSAGVNSILDPILIFGWFGAPALGIAGAAIATLISQTVFIVCAMIKISSPKMMVPFRFSNLSFHWPSVKRVLGIGFPAALTNALGPVGIAIIILLASSFFHEAGAIAVSIGFRVEFFAFLPAIGYGVASMAMLGQNIGAKNVERARQAYRTALRTGSSIAAIFGIVMAVLAVPIVSFFTSDPTVSLYARSYLWMVPLSYGFLAAALIEATSFQGIGKSWPGFFLAAARIAIVATLAVCFLQFAKSIFVLWLAVIIGYVIVSVLGYYWLNMTMRKLMMATLAVDAAGMKEPATSG